MHDPNNEERNTSPTRRDIKRLCAPVLAVLGLLLCVPWLLVRVNVPDDVVRETVDAVARALCHFGETFCLGLVLECVAGEVDACESCVLVFSLKNGKERNSSIPDLCTSAFTRMLTPPIPSRGISTSLFSRQSPILAM